MPSTTRSRSRGERGVAIIITALCLIPLMTFAAFGVDLASWYSRTSFLQKSADAAALAGTVWMPNISKSRTVACESLLENGIDGGDCGTGDFEVTIRQGATSSSLRVTVTDPNATRYFSQVLGGGAQRLSRSAEAEYNLPLPLGSPLNYFGGDASQTLVPAVPEVRSMAWPDPSGSGRAPAVAQIGETQQVFNCRVDATGAVAAGGWSNATTYSSGITSGGACYYAALSSSASGTTNVPPPDYTRRAPTNSPCNVFHGTTTNGRWESATTYNNTARYTTGSGNKQCTWSNVTTNVASLTPVGGSGYTSTWYQTNVTFVPTNRPCNVGWSNATGGYATATATWTAGTFFTGTSAAGNRLCRWPAFDYVSTAGVPASNPIPSGRSPGFWAMIYGPGQYAANGDAFSTRCTSGFNCGSVQNAQYRALTDPNRGYWYSVQIPTGVSGNVDINVFDASYNHDTATRIMDSTEGAGTPDFETEFRVYKQTNPLDFTGRTTFGSASAGTNNPADGGCWWKLRKESGFFKSWSKLCTIAGVQPGESYLVNVRTNTVGAANEAGNNGYAIEAVLNGNRDASPGPSIYAYGDMGMANQNVCGSGTCDGTFYLAKVGPQFAGKTLVIEMFDAGDSTGAGVSTVYPMKPSPTAPMPSVNVPAADCTFTATPDPNPYEGSSDLRIYSGQRRVITPTAPDSGDGSCGIRATVGGVRQFNGEWLRIRVDIPATYDCNAALNNPQTEANTCWWGIRYRFNGNASDTTTWQARVEGNPVHLTQ